MQKQQRFIPKTALIVSTILLAAGGIATTSTAYAGSFAGLPKSQAMSWFASPKQKEPGPGMNQGYLVFHNSKTTYKGKAKKAENILKAKPFGPVHFTKNKDGNTTNFVWKIPFDRETAGDLAGKIGCFYENAASFRPHGKMTAQHLDAAMVVVGWNQAQDKDFNRIKQYYLDKNHGTSESHNIYNYISKHAEPVRNQVWFDTNSIGLSAQGKGSISVAIQFYDHKTHKRVYPKSAYTLKDMDERQHFSVGNLIKGGSAGDRVYYGYDDSKKKNRYKSHTLVKYDNAYGSNPTNTTFEGDPKIQGDDYVPKGISGDTVYTHDPRGWIKFFDKWSQNGHPLVITFHHNMNGYHTTYGMYEKHPYVQKGLMYMQNKFGTSTNISKYGHLKNPASLKSTGKADKKAGLDYFSLGGTADEPDQPITFTGKMVGTSEKGKYYSHLALAGSKNKKFYFDVYGDVEWPGMRTGGVTGSTDNMNYQGLPAFQLQDKVDEQLTVGKPQVYQTASNTKYYSNDSKNGDQAGKLMLDSNKQSYGYLGHAKNVTSWFDIPDPKKLSDGKHLVMASAKKSVLKASNTAFYNHVYHLIIPVTADHVKYNLTDFKMANNLIKKGTTLDVSKDKVGSTHVDDSVKEYVTTQTSGTVAHGSSITTFKTVKSGQSESGTNWHERKFSAVKHATIQNIGGLNEPVNGAIENSKNWKHTQPASVTILQVPEKWDSDTKAVKHAYVKPYGSDEFDYDHPWDGKLIWDDSSDDYDGAGSLAPGQDVAYRAKFHFDKLITLKETRKEFHKNRPEDHYATVDSNGWKKIVITDKLDDDYDMSTLKDVTIGVNEPDSQKASYTVNGHTLKITLKYENDQQKPLLEQLALAGGELEIQYHAKLKNDSSLYSKDDKHPTLIKNTTKIDPNESQAMKMSSVIHYQKKVGPKNIHSGYFDDAGNFIPTTSLNPDYKPSKWKELTPRDFKAAMEFTKSHPDVEDAEKYNFKVKKFADFFGSTGRHHGITNTTINPVHVPIPMAAQKTLFEQAPSHVHYQLAADKIRPNHEYYVDVTQPVGNPGDYPRGFKDFEMSDDFKDSDVLTYQKAEVLKDGQYLTNNNISHDGNKVTWKPNPKSIVPDGSTYTLRIFFKAKNSGVDGANVADNASTILTDPSQPGDPRGGDTNGDKVTIMGKTLPLSISKDVARIYDTDTHRAVLKDRLQETILDPQHNYDITYHVVLTPGTKGKQGFSLHDPMPDNTTLDKGSVKVTSHAIDNANGTGNVATSNNSTDNELRLSSNNNASNSYLDITYTVHVKGEGDWSEYFNHPDDNSKYQDGQFNYSALDASGSMDNPYLAISNKSSYLTIPNHVYANVGGEETNSSAVFKMGAQTFDAYQAIVQDDDKWTNNLDPSHYLLHNSLGRDAVTTAVWVRMPNYMKLKNLLIATHPYTKGFDEVGHKLMRSSHALMLKNEISDPSYSYLMNSKAPLVTKDLKNPDLNNLDKVKPDLTTATDWQDTDHETTDGKYRGYSGKLDQSASGKTYYFFTKWAPKTKYYKDYAKLPTLNTGFYSDIKLDMKNAYTNQNEIGATSQVNDDGGMAITNSSVKDLGAHGMRLGAKEDTTLNEDDTSKTNPANIHLSNIYAYYTNTDKATYSVDGKRIDYTTYGELKGLAVDTDHVTDFKREGMPITEWISSKDGSYKSPVHRLTFTKHLRNNETEFVTSNWTDLPSNKLADVYSDHSYKSDSTLNTQKGHSIVLTSVLTDPIKAKTVLDMQKNGTQDIDYATGYDDNGNINRHNQDKNNLNDMNWTLIDHRHENDIKFDKFRPQTVTKVNTTYTNPKEFITYFDYNYEFGGADLVRPFLESYEMGGKDDINAKAGYGLKDNHQLFIFGYDDRNFNRRNDRNSTALKTDFYEQPSYDELERDYKTRAFSPKNIFDLGDTLTANNEALDIDYNKSDNIITNNDKIDAFNHASTSGNKTVDDLIDQRDANTKLAKAREKWHRTASDYHLTVMRYRFNHRFLNQGRQGYDPENNAYFKKTNAKDGSKIANMLNQNRHNVTTGSNGGYVNYLRHGLPDGKYQLVFNTVPFGVGNVMQMNIIENIHIYGHNIMSKNGIANNSKEDELMVQPVITGKYGKKPKGFTDKEAKELNDNTVSTDTNLHGKDIGQPK